MAGAVVVVILLLVLGLEMRVEGFACTKDSVKEPGKCNNKTVSGLFTVEMFEGMFKHRNDRVAHAPGFWSYGSFLSAAKMFERAGFGSEGGDDVQKRELAAFFAHVAHETSCGWPGSKDGPYAWGLCYNQELSPGDIFCTEDLLYPCAPGATYYGVELSLCTGMSMPLAQEYKGSQMIISNTQKNYTKSSHHKAEATVSKTSRNYNYGPTGVALKQDLLHHPEILANNETIAWQAAIWYWMTPAKARPSPHQVMVGKWLPSKNDTLANRQPGFGMTINIKASNGECGHEDDTRMQDRIGHYIYFLQGFFGGVDPGLHVDCGSQDELLLEYATL